MIKIMVNDKLELLCEIRCAGTDSIAYVDSDKVKLKWNISESFSGDIKKIYRVCLQNDSDIDFEGVVHFKIRYKAQEPKFFMPGYMYNRNTADMPSSGRKAFPRIRIGADTMPESEYWMTRSDRLALPLSVIYDNNHIVGISAAPVMKDETTNEFINYCGFTCNINDDGCSSVGYTLGYENAPWLFVQTATVKDREAVTLKNSFALAAGETYAFDLTVYEYEGGDERAIYKAVEDVYWLYHEAPRHIEGIDTTKALVLLSSAIRDYAWLEDEHIYSGFVYDRPEGLGYNKIPSLTWTNGLAVAVPMLMAADVLGDEKARNQSITFINETIKNSINSASGFLYESMTEDKKPTVKGWWYNGMHSGGHSSYLNGQAIYYILKAYRTELEKREINHKEWIVTASKVVARMNSVMNTDYEYPFAMSEKTGAGIEYDSMGGVWFLTASAMYELVSGDKSYIDLLLMSEEHYYRKFVKKVECYGGPLDTDKAVDSEGILGFIRAVRLLHEITGHEYLLDHLRDALYYEFTFKLGYNTVVKVRPLSEIGWSSCGGSITSTANPHIHPMSSTVVDEIRYYCNKRDDAYAKSRLADTIGWGLQTFNTYDKEYGYGYTGWMSERFCFCEGLLTEHYPDGEIASTWFALMPWAAASIIEGLV